VAGSKLDRSGITTCKADVFLYVPKLRKIFKVKPPLAGPGQVVRYLSRYVHRVAIANSRAARRSSRP
jgi:hypothetical protein